MSVLQDKKVLLGVTGGIAAYKAAPLVREFIKKGAEVRVVMTPAAKDFVTPLTLSTLSKNPVLSSFTSEEEDGAVWNNHVELGLWADFFVIAPATANTLAKMASGTSDNLLLATYLSAKCPVYFAPAMDLDMHEHPSTQQTFDQLEQHGLIQIPAEHGELASGLHGPGRMAEPEHIVAFIEDHLLGQMPLYGKKLMITAGPTYEAIDPVRFIGNHSSGKMGYALAHEAARLGAQVTLISGPSAERVNHPFIQLIKVTDSQEMYTQVMEVYEDMDIVIAAAAVADYKPVIVAEQKIKKKEGYHSIDLEPTRDILASMGQLKKEQFLVGFALETENEEQHAQGKLKRKNLDMIVLNSLNDKGAGFRKDTNKITVFHKNGAKTPFEVKTKAEVAKDIFALIQESLHA
ncbi:bifunctional phosphopantothenoylcysteine decarboxylase/phosphopantothenate--cysteine ligase CoaBC [Croceiramulus getboli]|nr:bifunctional phosphopantothenoylcysteine decarboxylase/phosphopantothenate--cysteine ligase CoaBC [Flavobacteriaceae bacterium YJPT1-3]